MSTGKRDSTRPIVAEWQENRGERNREKTRFGLFFGLLYQGHCYLITQISLEFLLYFCWKFHSFVKSGLITTHSTYKNWCLHRLGRKSVYFPRTPTPQLNPLIFPFVALLGEWSTCGTNQRSTVRRERAEKAHCGERSSWTIPANKIVNGGGADCLAYTFVLELTATIKLNCFKWLLVAWCVRSLRLNISDQNH